MTTLVVSDLHLGAFSELDLARRDPYREALVEAARASERLVLLGDVLELRELGARTALERARPLLAALADVLRGREVVVVAGNHDHPLARPLVERARLAGEPLSPFAAPVAAEAVGGLAAAFAEHLAPARVAVAYPGVALRSDVYATHGHYLDLHLTVPKIESLAAAVLARMRGRGWRPRTADEHERTLSPLYALLAELAELAPATALVAGGRLSRKVWLSANGSRIRPLARARAAAVAGGVRGALVALRAAGIDSFAPQIDGATLRRAGLRAIAAVASALELEERYRHLVFGHTHRAGPLPGDAPAEWRTARGTQLWNSGCWIAEPALAGSNGLGGYAPGYAVLVPERGEPLVKRLVG